MGPGKLELIQGINQVERFGHVGAYQRCSYITYDAMLSSMGFKSSTGVCL